MILPLTEDNRLYIAYSEAGGAGRRFLPDAAFHTADVFEITENGNVFLCSRSIEDGALDLALKPGQALALAGTDA